MAIVCTSNNSKEKELIDRVMRTPEGPLHVLNNREIQVKSWEPKIEVNGFVEVTVVGMLDVLQKPTVSMIRDDVDEVEEQKRTCRWFMDRKRNKAIPQCQGSLSKDYSDVVDMKYCMYCGRKAVKVGTKG